MAFQVAWHPIFNMNLKWVRELHDHVTRNAYKVHIRQSKIENVRNMAKYHGAFIWNKSPEVIAKSPASHM